MIERSVRVNIKANAVGDEIFEAALVGVLGIEVDEARLDALTLLPSTEADGDLGLADTAFATFGKDECQAL